MIDPLAAPVYTRIDAHTHDARGGDRYGVDVASKAIKRMIRAAAIVSNANALSSFSRREVLGNSEFVCCPCYASVIPCSRGLDPYIRTHMEKYHRRSAQESCLAMRQVLKRCLGTLQLQRRGYQLYKVAGAHRGGDLPWRSNSVGRPCRVRASGIGAPRAGRTMRRRRSNETRWLGVGMLWADTPTLCRPIMQQLDVTSLACRRGIGAVQIGPLAII